MARWVAFLPNGMRGKVPDHATHALALAYARAVYGPDAVVQSLVSAELADQDLAAIRLQRVLRKPKPRPPPSNGHVNGSSNGVAA